MLTPKYKAIKLGIAPRSQSYQRSAEVADDLNVRGTSFFSKTDPKILMPCHPLFIPGYYYASSLISFSPSDISWDDFPADTVYAFAYPIPRRIKVHKIAISVGGASGTAGSTLRMALYDSKDIQVAGLPWNLIRDFGTVATDSTGVKLIVFSDDPLILPADLYWLALNNSHALVDLVGGTAAMGIMGYPDEPINAAGFHVPYSYQAFPSTFPQDARTPHKIGLRYGFCVSTVLE